MSASAEDQHGETETHRAGGVRNYDQPEKSVNQRLLLSLWFLILLVLMLAAIAWLGR